MNPFRVRQAVANVKLYAQKEEGFVGYGLKRGEGELVGECSDIDDIIVIRKDGIMQVSKVSQKAFFGRTSFTSPSGNAGMNAPFTIAFLDGATGRSMMKRFNVPAITRDRIQHYQRHAEVADFVLHGQPGEAEIVTVFLRANARLKKLKLDVDFSELAIRGRGAGATWYPKTPSAKLK